MIGFVNAKTDDIYDHIKLTQRNFQPNVYISHVGTNSLTTDMTPEEICEKIITFSKHLKSESNEIVVSGIVPRGDFYWENGKAVNKLVPRYMYIHKLVKVHVPKKICILFVTVTLMLSDN